MNNWISNNTTQIELYLEEKETILTDRKRMVELLLFIFQAYFSEKTNLSILDLGCGDGSLTALLNSSNPDNNYVLLDGSSFMLSKAREQNGGENFTYIESSFEELINQRTEGHVYDFVFSSMAIHHLAHNEKCALFNQVHTLLKFGGLFLIIDVTLPVSTLSEQIQFKMWSSSILNASIGNNKQNKNNSAELFKPETYKNNLENRASTLKSQLKVLEQIGFADVECYYKNGIFALFGGTKI
ncbi:MAG: methyltransferase domain-containing protein [Spirochaetes bacterium]|jgi:tRNA (cmo5U34)-methyltransferase|nr:methyltransferase domain-containing protein [Spirochaetota bacterium]